MPTTKLGIPPWQLIPLALCPLVCAGWAPPTAAVTRWATLAAASWGLRHRWRQLASSEIKLSEQFNRFVADFSRVEEADALVSTLGFPLPYAARLFPTATFDLRQLFLIHAHGIKEAATNGLNRNDKSKAFTLSAELLLMQHSCHWFCKGRAVASARMMVRHKTAHAQLLEAVSPETRKAYAELTGI